MSIRSSNDLAGMVQASEAVAETLRKMTYYAKPGMSTLELDEYGYQILRSYGANPAPKKEYGFPGWNCISINNEAAHGVPSDKVILKEGDLVNIDVSAELNGYFGDNGSSFVLGKDKKQLEPLVSASKEILYSAISRIRGGVKIAAIGAFIESEAKKRGFTTIKNLVGHGIGRKLHDEPFELPNFNDRSNFQRFRKNTVVALETFISTNARYVYEMSNGWTMKPKDNSYIAQHEHTLIVTDGHPMILTRNNGI
ncbi:type I methionyl aminopeptidase [Fulvivirgaceae bacterium BMA10]|uniref:Methionine aminopeptidase n=1 Tax=Splendidivirga corallicola TaxID=3051826 RepID=A0ABT8KIQ0_9BACT|nr:type I methionyl aminopeptidase [Fulvivirgaceae bacterium BMA10]